MTRAVICVSHQLGAGGPDVAAAVADRLGYRYVDEDIIVRAAREHGVTVTELRDAEHRPTFVSRLFSDYRRSQVAGQTRFGIHTDDLRAVATKDDLRALIRDAIEEIAAESRVVIVAHAASYALSGRADVLRVLVVAPERTRRHRVAEAHQLDDKHAQRALTESDSARADYLKRFYGVDRELPEHYDIVVNSDHVEPADLAAVIVTAAS
jgi:cytidylate kinase